MPATSQSTSSALVREQQVFGRIARQFGMGEETLRTRLAAVRREQSSRTPRHSPIQAASVLAKRVALSAWERELMELVVHEPTVIAMLAEQITADDIADDVCRCIFAKAVELMHAGQVPTFDQLMVACDDAEVKNLLVDFDESGRDKKSSDPQRRVTDLLAQLEGRQQLARHQSAMSQFSQKRLDPGNEDQALAALFTDLKRKEETKRRQAGSTPTDG